MGNYNPHAPYIVGQEWVPIRQANFVPDMVTERGYTFTLGHSVVPVTGAFYVSELPENVTNQSIDLVSVYRQGQETLTGPVKYVDIPVSAVWTTGASISSSDGVNAAALANPSDTKYIMFTSPSDGFTFMGLSFDVPSYSQQLMGKRILDVSILYAAASGINVTDSEISEFYGFAKGAFTATQRFFLSQPFESARTGESIQIHSRSLSSINPFWDATRDPYQVHDVYPWRYQELARFAATEPAGSRMIYMYTNQLDSSSVLFYYVGMRVTYCEETRILYGANKTKSFQNTSGTATDNAYGLGPNLVRLRDTNLASGSQTLTPGNYTVTSIHAALPIDEYSSTAPQLAALRELYQLPNQIGLQINQTLTPDAEFTKEELAYLPEITLHTSSAVVTGVHPYGVQDAVPVYGTITATQEIEDDPVGASRQFPQVRFYARRFGNTTVPLTLVDVATGTFSVSISVADFDALPEIVDGWKEVNLRFSSPPSFATAAGDVDWRWTATSESAGNQWQVLGAGSRAFAAHSIGPASYYAPQGNTVTLTWQSPAISGTADDTLSDAVLLFAQDPPGVTGFALETASQALTGVSEHCGVPNGCVPTAITYNRLTWSTFCLSSAISGGGIELQRSDEITDWQTIMLTDSPCITGFSDYEARVGVETYYRIRSFNALDFYGSWSSTLTGTIPAPGVTVGGDGNAMLIFTSNEQPTSNLAYPMSWENTPIEEFVFPEAGEVQLQRMYGKDFFTAFHPLERGGVQFERTLMVSAAAIPLPSLENFHGLRDLAWSSINYVCVRDELGNRWFTNIRVPSGSVRMNRTIYLAQVQVTQTTDTPTPLNVETS